MKSIQGHVPSENPVKEFIDHVCIILSPCMYSCIIRIGGFSVTLHYIQQTVTIYNI